MDNTDDVLYRLSPDTEILLISDVYFSTSTEMMAEEPVILYERFLEYKKLCRSTIFVFKFVIKSRHIKDQPDRNHIAKSYLIKIFNLKYSIREFPTYTLINEDTPILIISMYSLIQKGF